MTINRWLIIVAIVLAVIVASVESLWQSTTLSGKNRFNPAFEERSVKLYGQHIKRWQFDEQGVLQLTVISPKLLQYQNSERYWLTLPEAEVYKGSNIWYVSADNAYADKQYQQIKLLENVQMQRASVLIQSEDVVLDNKEAKAFSHAKVLLSEGSNMTEAQGFEVALDKQSILLKKQVKSIYAPVTRP